MKQSTAAFRKVLAKDPKMKMILGQLDEPLLEKNNKIYLRICRSILSQQLSVKVARVLYQRFLDLYEDREPTAQQILETPVETFRGIGFSRPKSGYIHNVCNFFIVNKITDRRLHKMDNEEVIDLLTQIKGVGRWTVEMILMYSLAREDVFPIDDLGIRNAMIKLYGIKETDKKKLYKKLNKISSGWAPYRTYGCMYLWDWLDAGGL